MSQIRNLAIMIVALFVVAYVAEMIPPLKQMDNYFKSHPQPYLGIAIGLAVAGLLLFVIPLALNLFTRGTPMSEEEARRFAAPRGVFKGKAAGVDYDEEHSFSSIKDAVRSGAWLRDPQWIRFLLITLGGILLFFGMFGAFFVIGALTVKLIIVAAVVYAIARASWAFIRS